MNLYKIYNFPVYNHHIGKSLQYILGGTYLAITKDNKYAAILLDTWKLLNVLWQLDISAPWILAFTMLTQVNGVWLLCSSRTMTKLVPTVDLPYIISLDPQAHYLDQGLLAISVETPIPMEVNCKDHSHC